MAKPKAILFDLDGTLRDSRDALWLATDQTLEEHGIKASRELIQPHIHHHKSVHKELASQVPFEKFEKTFRDKLDALRPSITLYSAVPQLITDLHRQGYRLALVTSASTAKSALQKASLDHLFEVIVADGDTKEHKPHPEPVRLALQSLNCRPEEVVMVGDLPADIIAANGAGVMTTIALTHGFGTKEMLKTAGATYIINKLEELPALLDTI